jgi:iron transport multicopper oxidase
MSDGTYHAMFNGITHNFPLVPTMFSELTLGRNATNPNAYGPLSFVLNYGEVIDLVVKNGDTRGGHPL